VAMPFTLKKYLKEKGRIMENSNVSPCQNSKNPLKKKKPTSFKDIITL
jgi:hypothetical protein